MLNVRFGATSIFLQIDVRLIESIEQHEAVHIERVRLAASVCETAEVRTEFDGERNLGGSSNAADGVDVNIFNSAAGDFGSRGYFVDV